MMSCLCIVRYTFTDRSARHADHRTRPPKPTPRLTTPSRFSTRGFSTDGCPPVSSPCSGANRPTAISRAGASASKDGKEVTDEIALNPSHFRDRSTEQSLSTLVHEMTHLEQHHFGKPSRAGYHNKQWAGMMKAVGLIPSDTGAPGGKEVGQKVTPLHRGRRRVSSAHAPSL